MILLLACIVIIITPVAAATTSIHIVKYANDRTTILNETTTTYQWLESNLPVLGDETTNWYLQGPVFSEDRWNPAENNNLKNWGRNKGTNVRDLCNLVGGMQSGETVKIWDGSFSKTFPYENVYNPDPRQGPMIISWWFNGSYVPAFADGMRLLFLADTSNNPDHLHCYGVRDMNQTLPVKYQYFYYDNSYADPFFPTTTGLSVKYVNEIIIYSNQAPPSTITVTSPNGGETWQRGTSHTITWDYAGNPGSTVKIMLIKGGIEVGTINASTSIGSSGHGSYTWPISSTGSTGSDYRVSVQSLSQPTIKDTSNNNFIITSAATTSSITVTSPNGGETWQRGTSHTITWDYAGNLGSTVKIMLIKGGIEVGTINASTSIGSSGHGSYTWPISSTGSTGSDYKVSVQSLSQPTIKDTSNNNFIITSAATTSSITVTSPNGGETWLRGTSHTVTWDYTGSPGTTVKIMLIKGGIEVGTINASTSIGSSGHGSYTWPISSTGSTGSDYRVSVQSLSQPTIKDTSNNNFIITSAATTSSITITSPNGGETWQRGTSHTVTWDYTGSPGTTVKVMLVKGGSEVGTINASTSIGSGSHGSYTWPISPTGSTGSDYKVSVQSLSQPTIKDVSNIYFTLTL